MNRKHLWAHPLTLRIIGKNFRTSLLVPWWTKNIHGHLLWLLGWSGNIFGHLCWHTQRSENIHEHFLRLLRWSGNISEHLCSHPGWSQNIYLNFFWLLGWSGNISSHPYWHQRSPEYIHWHLLWLFVRSEKHFCASLLAPMINKWFIIKLLSIDYNFLSLFTVLCKKYFF